MIAITLESVEISLGSHFQVWISIQTISCQLVLISICDQLSTGLDLMYAIRCRQRSRSKIFPRMKIRAHQNFFATGQKKICPDKIFGRDKKVAPARDQGDLDRC